MKRAVALRHVAFEDLDALAAALVASGYEFHYRDAAIDGLAARELAAADLLVVLGGPIGVYEEADYPFLAAETALIARRLAERRPVLGICLGAQLMAKALGAKIYPAGFKEIGWAPIELTRAGKQSPLAALDGVPVLHWHGDTFDLPAGAELLAASPRTAHQAFAVGRHGLALQFHIETTAKGLERWYVGHTCEIAASDGVSIAELRAQSTRHAPGLVAAGERVLAAWLAGF
ncbi:MAG TPA: glutamine amidotransferase [Stellaceae bacterium]|nr:glutamine amidotransferase [Stellaceae bacterium]